MKSEEPLTPITPRLDGTPSEQLAYFENQILVALKVERDIGPALFEIKSRKLFKIYHLNFGDFCEARFSIKKSRAYQLVKYAEACAAAVAAGQLPPPNERAYREVQARRAGKGSRPAELARLRKILRNAVMAQPPEERTNLIQNLQLFLGRFAKDLIANQACAQPPSAALTPAMPFEKPTLPVASTENLGTVASTNVIMTAVTAQARPSANTVANHPTDAGLNLADRLQKSQGLGCVTPMTMAEARQRGLVW